MKFVNQLVTTSLAVAMLSGCSGSAQERRQANDDFNYLDVEPKSVIVSSDDQELETYPNYEIPAKEYRGGLGKDVDIRPPQQVLELIPGARVESQNGVVTLWLLTEEERDKVWFNAEKTIQDQKITLRENTGNRIETDWVSWQEEGEETSLSSRFEMERFEKNARYGFQIRLIAWKEGSKERTVSATNKERYNTFMTNMVVSRYDQYMREEAAKDALELVKVIPVSMGKDRSGLPIIIARAQYNVFWQRIPELLPSMGFNMEARNQSQGTIQASYIPPNDEFWKKVGSKPLNYNPQVYTFLLGDLGNRTSINITDATGKPVTEEMLNELVPIFAEVMKHDSDSE
jgi:outer membrane protein assembly factor BamC